MFRNSKNKVIWFCFVLFWIMNTSISSIETSRMTTYHLGFCLSPGPNSSLITFAIIGTNTQDKIVSKRFISTQSFIRQGMGIDFSPANAVGVNLFEKYGLLKEFYRYDSIRIVYKKTEQTFSAYTLEDLWTLKYKRNPMCPEDCIPTPGMLLDGWAQNNRNPSWPQLQILQRYGIVHISDFFYGEKMFELFIDIHKPEWRKKYKEAT